MKFGVGMLTFDRIKGCATVEEYGRQIDFGPQPTRNYLDETLASWQRSLANNAESYELHLFDSGSPDPSWLDGKPGVHHIPERKLTPNENAIALLRGIANLDCEWGIFLEDDLTFCADFLGSTARWLQENASPDRHVYTLYTPYPQILGAMQLGDSFYQYPVRHFYGTQALAMRREDMESAANGLEAINGEWHSSKGYDLMMKEWAKRTWPRVDYFLASAPSFVQHVGTESAISAPSAFHYADSFQGEEWSYEGRVYA